MKTQGSDNGVEWGVRRDQEDEECKRKKKREESWERGVGKTRRERKKGHEVGRRNSTSLKKVRQ